MKRLNRKGFTLVELLAVIVILAIVVGIAMMTIVPTLSNSKSKSLDVAVETIKRYIQDQHELYILYGSGVGYDSDANGADNYNELVGKANSGNGTTGDLLAKTGYDKNIADIGWTYSGGQVTITCLTLTKNTEYAYSDTYTESNVCS